MPTSDLVTVIGFILQFLSMFGGGIWAISRLELRLKESLIRVKNEVDIKVDNLHKEFSKSITELESKIDSQYHNFGENTHAIRTKIHDVELWARDNLVPKEAVHLMRAELHAGIEKLEAHMDKRFDALENRE